MGDLSENFSWWEFECKCCHKVNIDLELVEGLEDLREVLQKKIIINSGYRCKEHNKKVGGVSDSRHLISDAADIISPGYDSAELCMAAEQIPVFQGGGIGFYPGTRFAHVDCRSKPSRWKRVNRRIVGMPLDTWTMPKELRDAYKGLKKQAMTLEEMAAFMDVEPARALLYVDELARKSLVAKRKDGKFDLLERLA